jgi:hypothetical protein
MSATRCSQIPSFQPLSHTEKYPHSALTTRSNRHSNTPPTADDRLCVSFAQNTFDSEGLEQPGPYFSRVISWPKLGNSGVTIGRGYDMGLRSYQQVVRELTAAGMSQRDAQLLAHGAGKRGSAAAEFVAAHKATAPVMSLEVQKKLFEDVTTPQMINDIQRIFKKPETVAAYGRIDWSDLSPAAQELVFDLRYRGDYTPRTRQVLQPALVSGDYQRLKAIMNDTRYWATLGVPAGRIRDRQEIAENL